MAIAIKVVFSILLESGVENYKKKRINSVRIICLGTNTLMSILANNSGLIRSKFFKFGEIISIDKEINAVKNFSWNL